jgi:hypothetical protein
VDAEKDGKKSRGDGGARRSETRRRGAAVSSFVRCTPDQLHGGSGKLPVLRIHVPLKIPAAWH